MDSQLCKLIQQCGSDNPHEALNASGMAVALMLREGLSVDDVLQSMSAGSIPLNSLVTLSQAYARKTTTNTFQANQAFSEILQQIYTKHYPSFQTNPDLSGELLALQTLHDDITSKMQTLQTQAEQLQHKETALKQWEETLKQQAKTTPKQAPHRTRKKHTKTNRPSRHPNNSSKHKHQAHKKRSNYQGNNQQKNTSQPRSKRPQNSTHKPAKNKPQHPPKTDPKNHPKHGRFVDGFVSRKPTQDKDSGKRKHEFIHQLKTHPILTFKLFMVSLLFGALVGGTIYLLFQLIIWSFSLSPFLSLPVSIEIMIYAFPFMIWKSYQLMDNDWYP